MSEGYEVPLSYRGDRLIDIINIINIIDIIDIRGGKKPGKNSNELK